MKCLKGTMIYITTFLKSHHQMDLIPLCLFEMISFFQQNNKDNILIYTEYPNEGVRVRYVYNRILQSII
jgi:hypothetical protein